MNDLDVEYIVNTIYFKKFYYIYFLIFDEIFSKPLSIFHYVDVF